LVIGTNIGININATITENILIIYLIPNSFVAAINVSNSIYTVINKNSARLKQITIPVNLYFRQTIIVNDIDIIPYMKILKILGILSQTSDNRIDVISCAIIINIG
jgi:hypothetical protein